MSTLNARPCRRGHGLVEALVGSMAFAATTLAAFAISTAAGSERGDSVTFDAGGTVHIPPMTIPLSDFLTPEAKAQSFKDEEGVKKWVAMMSEAHPPDIVEQRRRFEERYGPALERVKVLYSTRGRPRIMNGVYTEVFVPSEGIAPKNRNRILINLHGGGFMWGARFMGALESIPVASLGHIKVVAVDYRQGPEYKFPAAVQDVVAVYRVLLKTYPAQNIGIYGCSAGGLLTAQVVPWIEKEHLPRPGAIGIFCSGADGAARGDSGFLGLPLSGTAPPPADPDGYFSRASLDDPWVSPVRSSAMLSQFPPTLIVTSSRDFLMSGALYTHSQLTKLGVQAELHVWEGLGHGFFTTDPDIPETKEVWHVVTKFFDRHLGCS